MEEVTNNYCEFNNRCAIIDFRVQLMLIGSFGLRLIITIFIIEEVFGNMNEIINALYQRKSVRVFTDDPITDEDKKLILTSAIQAPSAGCQLLYTILDITDQNKKDRLADLCDHQTFIAAGQMVLIFLCRLSEMGCFL